tara:strand:- start:820 stop:954 length:135 start_codon:yes stop_codon:yes gene_type:complete
MVQRPNYGGQLLCKIPELGVFGSLGKHVVSSCWTEVMPVVFILE